MPRDETGRWLKGTSPNPGGRPKGRGLQAEVRRLLAECIPGSQETRQERIARVLVMKAEQGDLRAQELILRREWPEKVEVHSDGVPTLILRDYTGGAAERLRAYEKWHAGNGPEPERPDPQRLASGDDSASETTIDLQPSESRPQTPRKRSKLKPDIVKRKKKQDGRRIERPQERRQRVALL